MTDPFLAARTRYLPAIKALAVAMSNQDPDFSQDLQQEGEIALWQAGPTRWPNVSRCQAIIRSAMSNYCRRERRLSGKNAHQSPDTVQRSQNSRQRTRNGGEGFQHADEPVQNAPETLQYGAQRSWNAPQRLQNTVERVQNGVQSFQNAVERVQNDVEMFQNAV